MLTPESSLVDILARIREKFGPNNRISLEIDDDQYGALVRKGDFDETYVFNFYCVDSLCAFLNKE